MRLKLLLLAVITVIFFTGCNGENIESIAENIETENKNTSENIIETENDYAPLALTEETDKSFFNGKWKSEEFEINGYENIIFMNIEYKDDESKPKIGYNFDTMIEYYPAVKAENREDSLYFNHNDEYYRTEYALRLESEDLINCQFSSKNCFGMQGIFEKNIKLN